MNKRHYEHTLPNIRGSLSNTYGGWIRKSSGLRPFVPKKITPDGFAVPNIFCRPKLFLIPPSLLLCAVKKRLINSDGA